MVSACHFLDETPTCVYQYYGYYIPRQWEYGIGQLKQDFMTTALSSPRRLSFRILRWVLLTALAVGLILSTLQVAIDARQVSREFDQRALATMTLVEEAATQAVYSIDSELGRQVIDGLFRQQGVISATISHSRQGLLLAQRVGNPSELPLRGLTDPIFAGERRYSTPLTRSNGQTYGTLSIRVDTAYSAQRWLERASLMLLSGMVRAIFLSLVLYLVFHYLVTKPLMRIIHAICRIDPERPADHLITLPPSQQSNELGTWVDSTNQLLRSIAKSQVRHQDAEARISRLSHHDQLTGLPSRENFLGQLTRALEEARRSQQMLGVFCLGLDDFKSLNDQHGYHVGDQFLEDLARRLSRPREGLALIAARLGGDQFVLIQQHIRESFEAAASAEWLLQEAALPITIDGQRVATTATVGVALFPDDASQPERLLQKAEQSMTLAKTAGKNRFQFYVASVDQEIRDRKQLERDLGLALAGNQFHLVYQPQINMDSQRVVGAEALLRWQHPEHGLIPPDQFIPLAELNHSIVEIGSWVLDQACAQAALWIKKDMPLRIAVNLSAVQLRQSDIVDVIMATLKKHRVPPQHLELEVTETSFMHNLDDAIAKLTQLRNAGILIAVDDFGTGYSSLTYVKRLPIQHLKIDKQFIQDLLVHEEDTHIANTIIDLGRSLNLNIIAEGVETEEQAVYLCNRGCYLAQGYYFSKPVFAAQFEQFCQQFAPA